MKKNLSLSIISIFIHMSILNAQKADSVSIKPKLEFKLRNSFESLDVKKDPAIISFTSPQNGKQSFLVDASMSLGITNSKSNITNFIIEYHRNTLIEKEINNYQVGVGQELLVNKNSKKDPSNIRSTYYNWNVKYSSNPKSNTEGIICSGQISWKFDKIRKNGDHKLLWNPNKQITGKYLSGFYTPTLGFEYQNNVKSDSTDLKGNVIRGTLGFSFTLSPSKNDSELGYMPSFLEYFMNFTYRQNLINTTKVTQSQYTQLSTGFNFRLTNDNKAKISLSYNKGSNPIQQLALQEYYLIALTIKI